MASFQGSAVAGILSAPDLSALLSQRIRALESWDDVRLYGVVGNGIADDTAALQSALNNVPTGRSLLVPPGLKVRITSPVSVNRSNMRLVGEPSSTFGAPGPAPNGSSIYVDDPGAIVGGYRVSTFRAIRVFGANFLMKDLYCYSNDNPWQGIANSVLSQETAVDLAAGSDGSAIYNCTFEYHFGHCIRHNSAAASDLLIAYCTFKNCANGLNIANGLRSVQIANYLERCNGIESGNNFVTVAYNTLIDSSGIAMGGTTSPPANTGHFCHHNHIVRPLSSGIVVTNVEDSNIEDNIIVDVSAGHGIAVVGNFGLSSARIGLRRNVINTIAGPYHGIWVAAGAGNYVEGNRSTSAGNCGVLVQTDGVHVGDNVLSGPVADLYVSAATPYTVYTRNNALAHANFRTDGTVTVIPY